MDSLKVTDDISRAVAVSQATRVSLADIEAEGICSPRLPESCKPVQACVDSEELGQS